MTLLQTPVASDKIPSLSPLVFWLFFLYIFLLAFTSSALAAQQNNPIESLQKLAEQKQLAKQRQWLRLLHYNEGGTLHSRKRSYINSSEFFLAAEGSHNPAAELQASIAILFDESQKEKRCSYIARFHWLSEQLEQVNYLQGIQHCELFLQTMQQVDAHRLVLVFPSSYLNNPSSLFGHTLLRIDPKDDNNESVILNWAINFGARFTENDNAVAYAFKGITGLYDGQFFVVPYAQKIKEYGQIENRDIWEYALDFSPTEVNFLLEHLWELRDINFNYYFFDENCSYRLLELLEVARPELELSNRFRLTEIPVNTVKLLEENQLIVDEDFRPSKERLLRSQFLQLEKHEQHLAINISKNLNTIETQTFQVLDQHKQQDILYAAYQHLRYQQVRKERDPDIAHNSLALLREINQLARQSEQSSSPIDVEQPASLLGSHHSQRMSLGIGKEKNGEHFQTLQLRMTYHDLLDNAAGYIPGAQIEGMSIRLKNYADETRVDQFKLVDIISLNPRSRINRNWSWKVAIKAERSDENNEHLHSIISGGRGLTWQFGNWMHYQLLIPRLEFSPDFEQDAKAGLAFQTGLLLNNGKHPSLLEYQVIKIEQFEIKQLVSLGQQIELSQNQALRFELFQFRQDAFERKGLELKYLFYF